MSCSNGLYDKDERDRNKVRMLIEWRRYLFVLVIVVETELREERRGRRNFCRWEGKIRVRGEKRNGRIAKE